MEKGFCILNDQVQQQLLKIKAPVPLNAQFLLDLIFKDGNLSLRGELSKEVGN